MDIFVNLNQNAYHIVIQKGVLQEADKHFNLKRKVLIVTDKGVPAIYAEMIASLCDAPYIVCVEEGESSKSIRVWEHLLHKMLTEHFTRADAVVAVGGGVVGDLAGFAAASFMRGIDFYNIPTTLLAQVDSSVGGKTALNLGGVKNIIGAFYQPKKVLIDSTVLETLDARRRACGIAEAVKMALCFDADLFELVESCEAYAHLDEIIARSVRIKADVVEQDEKEKGLRRVLNFGHTIGHGIEAQGTLYHGECVALGMLPMCAQEVRTRLEAVLKKYDLPLTCECRAADIIAAMEHDKKLEGEVLHTVVVPTVGSYEIRSTTIQQFKKTVEESY